MQSTLLEELARSMDISCVRAQSTLSEVEEMAQAAVRYPFAAVFAMPLFTGYLIDRLSELGSKTPAGGVAGFPSGGEYTSVKVMEAREGIKLGCREIDMVMAVGAFKSGHYDYVREDIRRVACETGPIPLKVILETSWLNDEEVARASLIAVEAGAAFIKTGTGWGPVPASAHTVALIKSAVGDSVKIKAAGGIRSLDTLLELKKAGCSRFGLGTAAALNILEEAKETSLIHF